MGVYIPGMKMPESCYDCVLCYDAFYCKCLKISLFGEQDKMYREKEFDPDDDRLPNCPLVHVPPHERLIDADDTMQHLHSEHPFVQNAILRTIKAAPTIIPADPAEEGKT